MENYTIYFIKNRNSNIESISFNVSDGHIPSDEIIKSTLEDEHGKVYEWWREGLRDDSTANAIKNSHPDTERLNKLQRLTKGYGIGWVLRESGNGRGMRLHETSMPGAVKSVRKAIDNYKEK